MHVDIFFKHIMTINYQIWYYIDSIAVIFASGWTIFSYLKYNVPGLNEEGKKILMNGLHHLK